MALLRAPLDDACRSAANLTGIAAAATPRRDRRKRLSLLEGMAGRQRM